MAKHIVSMFILLMVMSPVAAQADLPALTPITADNAAQVEQVDILGYGQIFDLAYSPDGETVAVASSLGILLYNSEAFDTAPYRRLEVPEAVTRAVAYSPNGNLLATMSSMLSSEDDVYTFRLWDTATYSIVAQWTAEFMWIVDGIAFSPDSTMLALSDRRFDFDIDAYAEIKLWDISDLSHIQYLPNANWNTILREWYAPNADNLDFLNEDEWIITYSPDGSLVAASDETGDVHVWAISSGEELFTFPPESTTEVYELLFSTDGNLLASQEYTEFGGRSRIWDTETGEELFNEEERVWAISFNPLEPGLLYTDGFTAHRWNAESRTAEFVLGYDYWANFVYSLAFSPEGTTLAVARPRVIEQWNVPTGVRLNAVVATDEGELNRVVYSPDGMLLASADTTGMVYFWDAETLEQRASIQHSGEAYDVAFSPDGRMLATYSRSDVAPEEILLWDVETLLANGDNESGAELAHIYSINVKDVVYNVVFSPDGQILAVTGIGAVLWIVDSVLQQQEVELTTYDMENVALETSFPYTAGPLVFSPDGDLLVTGDNGVDCYVAIWNLATETIQTCLEGPIDWSVGTAAFSPDGTVLAANSRLSYSERGNEPGSDNRLIRLWNAQTGELLNILDEHEENVWQIAFSPDGTLLASGSGNCYDEGCLVLDATVHLWGVPSSAE